MRLRILGDNLFFFFFFSLHFLSPRNKEENNIYIKRLQMIVRICIPQVCMYVCMYVCIYKHELYFLYFSWMGKKSYYITSFSINSCYFVLFLCVLLFFSSSFTCDIKNSKKDATCNTWERLLLFFFCFFLCGGSTQEKRRGKKREN